MASILKVKVNGRWVEVPALVGPPGPAPVKGKDYWTAEDKEDITAEVASQLSLESVPNFVSAEAERVAEAVNGVRTAQSLVLLCASDIHTLMSNSQSLKTTLHLAQGMNEICKRIAVDGIAILGDSAFGSSTSTKEETEYAFSFLRENLKKGANEIWIPGNHDHRGSSADGNYLSADELYNYIGANTTDKAVVDYDNIHRMYGYVDYSRQRIRVIYLNTSDITDSYESDYGMSTVQAQWLADTLAAIPEGWGVVVMSHHPLNGYISPYMGVLTILDAYKGKQAGTVSVGGGTVTYSFANAQGELICHLHGHIHNYQVAKYGTNGVLSITIPNGYFWRNNEYGSGGNTDWGDEVDGEQRIINKKAGTAEDTAYTAVVIDRKNGKVHALRCGAGVDRVWDYINGVEIETDSETPEQPETPDTPTTDNDITWYDGQRFSSSSGDMKSDGGNGQTSAYLPMDDLAIGEGYQITGLVFDGNAYPDTYVTAYENDTYTGHYFVSMGMDVNYATHYNVVVAADGSSLTIYKNSAPTDSSVSCKVGVTGGGQGANAVVTIVQTSSEPSEPDTPTEPTTYTNLVPTATDATGVVFNGKGYIEGKRWSSSSAGFSTYKDSESGTSQVLFGMIPFKMGQTLRVYNGRFISSYSSTNAFKTFAADRSNLATGYLAFSQVASQYGTDFVISDDETSLTFTPITAYSTHITENMAYIAMTIMVKDSAEDVIITVDGETTDSGNADDNTVVIA